MRAWLKLLKPIKRQLRLMITRGIVKLVDADTLFTELQVVALDGEVLDKVELFEQYGITSHPHDDAETILLSLNGKRSHTIALVAGSRQYRMKGLAKGEVALYTDEGDVIHFKRNNEILIDTMKTLTANAGESATVTSPLVNVVASTKVTLDTPTTECTGDLNVGGSVSAAAEVSDGNGSMNGMRGTFNGHGHPALNTPPSQQM